MTIERLPAAERYRFLREACRDPEYCCNHIAIEDGNLDDACVEFCVNEAKEKHHLDCLELAEFLLGLPEAQRYEVTGHKEGLTFTHHGSGGMKRAAGSAAAVIVGPLRDKERGT
jgi:hypothetical protein